jgi:hypothetical protein
MRKLKVLVAAAVLLCAALPAWANAVNLYGQTVNDLKNLSQDPRHYWKGPLCVRWLSEKQQRKLADDALKQFFRPWHSGGADVPDMSWAEKTLDDSPYTSSLTVRTEVQRNALLDDAQMDRYPSMERTAITVGFTACRVLPDERPAFADPAEAGEGFPFDYLQNSGVHAGTPLRVLHVNRRGDWYLCESPSVTGWIRARDIAFTSARFRRRYETGSYAAVIDDGTPLRNLKGRTLCTASIGAVFPMAGRQDYAGLLIPLRASDGTARLARVPVPEEVLPYPVPFTAEKVTAQARKFMGTLYGWGGLYGDRDCSMMIKDLMAPFGIMMQRNSRGQYYGSGAFIELKDMNSREKIRIIREKGLPFRSLIGFRGHIGLYLGVTVKGQPVIMHNLWGLGLASKKDPRLSGRLVIGRTVITTLTPCAGQSVPVAPGYLTDRILTLTFLPGISTE